MRNTERKMKYIDQDKIGPQIEKKDALSIYKRQLEITGDTRANEGRERERQRERERVEICKLKFIINSFEKSSVMILLSGLLYFFRVQWA